jgi:glycosyltransferase involved in cell wall biosynthesis
VIVPTYDRLALLRETMASVLEQTFGDLELIVVDDGSSDGTAEHVRAMTDPRVRLVALSHGGNVSRARNAGVAASRARWLCVLGSDDVWLPTKLERQIVDEAGAFREQFRFRQDYDLVVRIALRAPAHAVDESLVRAREHAGRTTTRTRPEEVLLHHAAVFHTLAREVGDAELQHIARTKEADLLMAAGKRLLRRGALLRAAHCVVRAHAARH